jgi:hypothetical protein
MQDNSRGEDLERRLETWAASHPDGELSPDAQKSVQDLLTASLNPVSPLPSQGRLALMFFAVFAVGSLALMAMMDKAGFHLMTGIQMVSMAVILICGGLLFSRALAGRMIPGSRPGLSSSLQLGLAGFGVAGGIALLFPWKASSAFVAEGWPCAAMEVMVAIPSAVVFWLLARRGALFADAGLGAVLSGLAVVLALTVLQFRCMFQQAPHLLVWHVATASILIGLGTLLGRWQRHRWLS